MNSLHIRLLFTSVIILAVFVSLTGWALDRAMYERAQQSWFNKLQGLAYSVLAETDINDAGKLVVADVNLAEPRLNQFDSGLVASVADAAGQPLWASASDSQVQPTDALHPGVGIWAFDDLSHESTSILRLRFGFDWQLEDERIERFTVTISEDAQDFLEETQRFSQTLWYWLLMASGFLLLALVLVLRWGLRPLRQIADDLAAIEQGETEQLSGSYPRELKKLSGNLNALLRNERQQHQRYRHALDELAHSLKTPLAVLRNVLAAQRVPEHKTGQNSDDANEQIDRLQTQIDYHLNRAAAAGQRRLHRPLELKAGAERVVAAMQKLHAANAVAFELDIPSGFSARIDEGDWLELLGNLLDNAGKWANKKVLLSVAKSEQAWQFSVGDDGPGFSLGEPERLLERGLRADARQTGQGIGLALVRDISVAYEAEVELGRSKLGGADVRLIFPN